MEVLTFLHAPINDLFALCAAIFVVSIIYGTWCYTRLYNLLARYGSSVLPDVYHDPSMNSFKQTYRRSPLIRYIQKKQFENEARPELRTAGERAHRGQQIIQWLALPAFVIASFLNIYFIHLY